MFELRELERSDLGILNKWRNDEEVLQFLGAPFRYINFEVDDAWFSAYIKNRSTQVRCSILSEGKMIGVISLTNIDSLNQSAEIHIMIGDKNEQGKGAGSFAMKKMVSHAFDNLNLQRLELTVLETNCRARNLYEKVGFILEGKARSAKFKNGAFVNMCSYGLLRSEYKREKNCEKND